MAKQKIYLNPTRFFLFKQILLNANKWFSRIQDAFFGLNLIC